MTDSEANEMEALQEERDDLSSRLIEAKDSLAYIAYLCEKALQDVPERMLLQRLLRTIIEEAQ